MVIKTPDNSPIRLEDEMDILYSMGIDSYEINYLLCIKNRRYDGGDD
ncbi:MAG: hypothetical protein Q7R52_05350 [archaeon]|nr:hypothetical protein [archaeon]